MPRSPLRIGTKRRPAPTTKNGWRAFVDDPMETATEQFGLREEWARNARHNRESFDRERIDHINSFVIQTPRMEQIHSQLQSLVEMNYGAVGARAGGVVDSIAGGYGKTWVLLHFGRWYEKQLRVLGENRRFAVAGGIDDYVPVNYIALRDGSAAAHIDEQLLRFGGAVIPKGPQRALTARVAEEAEACDTSLILVDDIHKLKRWRRDDVAIADHLNHLATVISATFVYAGIDCEASGVFSEGEADSLFGGAATTSTQGRFTHLKIEKFNLDAEWQALLLRFEEELVLLKSYRGMLCQDLVEYVYERTDGTIGAVSQLLRRGAIEAIHSGAEKLTVAVLDKAELAIAAEAARRRKQATQRSDVGSSKEDRGSPRRPKAAAKTP